MTDMSNYSRRTMQIKKKDCCIKYYAQVLYAVVLLLASTSVSAANVDYIRIVSLYEQPKVVHSVLPYAINLTSYVSPLKKSSIAVLDKLGGNMLYMTEVKVDGKRYYRLVLGNFPDTISMQKEMKRVKQYFPGAWINSRSKREIADLTRLLTLQTPKKKVAVPVIKPKPLIKKAVPKVVEQEGLLNEAKRNYLDGNYNQVIKMTQKIMSTGTLVEQQQAMELAGITRERQRKFAQAVALYSDFLKLYPDSEMTGKIKQRLQGLMTMRVEPKQRIAQDKNKSSGDDWKIFGSLSQFYRKDVISPDNKESKDVNSSLVSDLNLFARRHTAEDTWVFRFDGGIINDFLDSEDDSRISRAQVSYNNNLRDFQIIGGRQSHTAKGIYGRFDGVVFKRDNDSGINFSLYAGYPVRSSLDDLETERIFIGSSMNLSLSDNVDMDVYLVYQEVSGLIDRQILGAELQYTRDDGFLYGILDYDIFYNDVNNVNTIGNYRYSDKLSFNLNYDYRNSPLLSTENALQGQTVSTIDEMKQLFTDDEIYQLAEDRTSKRHNLFVGSDYQIDDKHQIYVSMSFSATDATEASSSVIAIPSSEDVQLFGDYTIRGFLVANDFTTFGLKLADSTSAKVISLRSRLRFKYQNKFKLDPRVNLDFRQQKNSDFEQWILKPSFKFSYKPNKKWNIETSFGLDYSNYKLPELDDQITYSMYLGYIYQFN